MIAEARRLLEACPFVPFAARTSTGHEHQVPTADHAKLNPRGTYLIVFFDDDGHVTTSGLHLVAVIEKVAA